MSSPPGPDTTTGGLPADPPRPIDLKDAAVAGDLAVLYELALAVGSSLDLRENCATFLQALMSAKDLDYAAVWLREDLMTGDGDARTYRCAYALPEAREPYPEISAEHPLLVAVRDRATLHYAAVAQPRFETERVPLGGAVAVFRLDALGLLKLHSSRHADAFTRARLGQMRSVVAAFARSLEGCLAHQRLRYEVEERQRAEEEARTIAERLHAVLGTVGDGITLSDDTGQFSVYNARMQEITGYTLEEANAEDLLDKMHPTEALRSRALEQLRRVEEEGSVSDFETEIVAKDGTRRTLLVSTSLMHYRGRSLYLSAFRDITERKRADREVRDLKQFYEQVLAAIPAQVIVFDLDGTHRYVNPGALADAEARADVLGTSLADYTKSQRFPEGVVARRLEAFEHVRQTGEADAYEETLQWPGGPPRQYTRIFAPLHDEDGLLRHIIAYGGEVSEQRAAEREVQRLKLFYEEILNSLPVDLAVFDAEGRYVFVNPKAVADPERRVWMIGKTNVEYASKRGLPEAFGAERHALIQEVLGTGQLYHAEEQIVDREGLTRHYVRRLSPIHDETGSVHRVIGYGIDVTERTRAEEALRASEARFKQFVEAASDIIYRLDMAGRFTYINPVALRIVELTEDEALGMPFDVLIPASHLDAVRAFYREQFAARLPNTYYELPLLTASGETVWVGQNVQLVFDDGRLAGVQALARDITERKRTETALRESEARKGAILESALDAVLTIDSTSQVIEFNPAAEAIFGYTREEAIGASMPELLVPEQYREAHREGMARYLSTGTSRILRQRIEITGMRKSGETFPVELAITPIPIPGGRLLFTAFLRDITERTRAEAALVDAKQTAEDSSRAKEQFLANMSHEIRTPMNAVLGMTHLLMGTATTGEQSRYLNAIKFSADNLLALINDLLDFSKIEAGKIVFEEVAFSIEDMLQGLADSLRFTAEERGLYLHVETAGDVPSYVVGDPVRLNQILINLVGNALKFTEDGGVRVLADMMERAGGIAQVRFRVEDSGIGIPEEKQALIFESFSQASSDTTRKYGGTGLGLAIVKELVALQDGVLELESTEEVGTTFTVILPYPVAEAPSQSHVEPAPESVSLEGARILLVEDNEVNQFVAHRMLERWGASVSIAENGRVAVERVAADPGDWFDLVLMDIQMPEMDGYEATRRIRGDLGRNGTDLPVLALTASTMADQRRAMLEAGMNEVVMKPFEPEMLRARIGSYLPPRFHARVEKEGIQSVGQGDPPPPLWAGERPNQRRGGRTSLHAGERTPSGSARRIDFPPQPAATPSPPAPTAEPEGPALDLNTLRQNALGDASFVKEMLVLAHEQMAEMNEHLTDALQREDAEQVAFAAHKLKSTAGIVGALTLHAALDALETEARREALTAPLATLAAPALHQLARTRSALDETLGAPE